MHASKRCEIQWGPKLFLTQCKFVVNKLDADLEETAARSSIPMQVSVHTIKSTSYRSELNYVFKEVEFSNSTTVTVICTMQHSAMELAGIGANIETEKDYLLENFVEFAKEIVGLLRSKDYFADYIDPCSGLPATSGGNSVFNEVQSAQILLGYELMNIGCCKVLLHPVWASAVYPASIITNCPGDAVGAMIEDIMLKKT